jgi:dTDP-4-amino-4,6-dideoxygalactose transaminase
MPRLQADIKKRKEIAAQYSRFLSGRFDLPSGEEHSYYRYVIQADAARDIIANANLRGVMAGRPVFKPLHRYKALPDSDFPNTCKAYDCAISVPIYPYLSEQGARDCAGVLLNSGVEK